MKPEEEKNMLEAELQQIQNEIDRRHSRVDNDLERSHNLEKIDELRAKKDEIMARLQKLNA